MRPTEERQIVRGAMRVVLNRGVERRRWKGQCNVAFIVDGVDAIGFRVIAMPVRTRVKTSRGCVSRNVYNEVRVLIPAGCDIRDGLLINLLRPSFWSVQLNFVEN